MAAKNCENNTLCETAVEYLKMNICHDNIIDICTISANNLENESLASIAIEHLVNRPQGKTMTEVPGFHEVFQATDKHFQDLLLVLSDKNS